ncbi:MAG TPA: ATP synthase subunit I [Methylocella sp.]|nr:ATP synthase subunit I [Methylocella sp.]
MTHSVLIAHLELTALMTIAGLMFGRHYFVMLKRSVTLFVGGAGCLGPLAMTLGRIAAAAAFLFGAAKLGAAPLLAAFIGFLIARALALRAERKAG